MSNLGSESEVLDLEKGKGSDPGTATASASVERAAAVEDEDPELFTDPRKAGFFILGVVLFCVVAIGVLVWWSLYRIYNNTVPFWEAFGLSAVYFIICALSIGTVLVLLARKPLISTYDDTTSTATSTPISDSATSSPVKLLTGLGFSI